MPTITELKTACTEYASSRDYDRSYLRFCNETGNSPNLFREDHRTLLLTWLNSWGCRQFSKEYHSLASSEILDWYLEHAGNLPSSAEHLSELPQDKLPAVQSAYEALSRKTASFRLRKGHSAPSRVTVSDTGASKILFAFRPQVFLPWDKDIRDFYRIKCGIFTYAAFLKYAKACAEELRDECTKRNLDFSAIPFIINRPKSSIPKLLDEYHWVKVPRRTQGKTPA